MPSQSFQKWRSDADAALRHFDRARRRIRGRRMTFIKQQMTYSFAVFLSAQFQKFCRDLHEECTLILTGENSNLSSAVKLILRVALRENNQLQKKNAQAGSIGGDFGRFGVPFWGQAEQLH